jgi:hypothetical protein
MADNNGGRRPGAGRKRGSKSQATIERALLAERIKAEAEMRGERLAKEVLNDLMKLFVALTEVCQPDLQAPGFDISTWIDSAEAVHFEKWALLARDTARDLAKYQSPTFRAVVIAPPPPTQGQVTKTFTLRVFDNHRPDPNSIEGRAARKSEEDKMADP